MSSNDPWATLPNLTGQSAPDAQQSLAYDSSRFFPGASGGLTDPVMGRMLNVPRARVVKTTGTSVPHNNAGWGLTSNNAWVTGGVAPGGFNQTIYDSDGMVDLIADDSAISCKTPGLYLCGTQFTWSGGLADGRRLLDLWYFNPNSTLTTVFTTGNPDILIARTECAETAPAEWAGSAVGVVPMNPGGKLRLRVFQNNSGGTPLNSGGGASSGSYINTSMWACLISTFGSDAS